MAALICDCLSPAVLNLEVTLVHNVNTVQNGERIASREVVLREAGWSSATMDLSQCSLTINPARIV